MSFIYGYRKEGEKAGAEGTQPAVHPSKKKKRWREDMLEDELGLNGTRGSSSGELTGEGEKKRCRTNRGRVGTPDGLEINERKKAFGWLKRLNTTTRRKGKKGLKKNTTHIRVFGGLFPFVSVQNEKKRKVVPSQRCKERIVLGHDLVNLKELGGVVGVGGGGCVTQRHV